MGMASIDENKKIWTDENSWEFGGNEWSKAWGSVDAEWYFFIFPRIKRLNKKNSTILEIAPGHGRWSEYLIKMSKKYIGVDLSKTCIDYCKYRFYGRRNTRFYLNDGKSLDMIKDNSIDFCFSFDSLVHADKDAVGAYIEELSKKLKEKSYAFIHHSNYLQYKSNPNFNENHAHFRAKNVDYLYVQEVCKKYNMHVVSQELIKWMQYPDYIDCISVIYKDSTANNIVTDVFFSKYYDFTQEYGQCLADKYGFKDERDFVQPNKHSLKYRLITISPQKIKNFVIKNLKHKIK